MRSCFVFTCVALMLGHALQLQPASADTTSVDLGGPASGYFAVANFKNSSTQNEIEGKDANGDFDPNHNGLPDYANFQQPGSGNFTAVIASPLTTTNDYSSFSQFYNGATLTFNNEVVSQSDAATLSAGRINFDNSLVTGTGTETVASNQLTFDLNTFQWDGVVDAEPRSNFTFPGAPVNISPFSPIYTEFNDGSGAGNAQIFYQLSVDNVTGGGLTFEDGQLSSMDFTADVTVDITAAPFAAFGSLSYTGTLSGNNLDYRFDIAGTDSLGPFNNVHFIGNRAGTAFLAIPEPGGGLLLGCFGLISLASSRWRSR